MKFKILFAVILFIILVCLGGVACAEVELAIISANFEEDILKQGESVKVTVTVENTGDSAAYDIIFILALSRLDIDDIKIDGHNRIKDAGNLREYFIDTKKTSINPGETKTAVYVITATAPEKEEYILRFVVGGRVVKDPRLSIEFRWWPKYAHLGEKFYLKIGLAPDYYFKKAEECFKSESYENVKNYAEKAKEIYINSGDNEKALNCDKIILQSEKIIEADLAYNKAKNRMDAWDFKGAASNAELSLKIYNEIDLIDSGLISDRVSKAELLIEEINKTITANEYFSNSTRNLDSGNYERAKEYAEKAKGLYLELEDTASVLGCNSLIKRSELYIKRTAMILNVFYAAGVIIFLLLVLLLYRKYRDRKYRKRQF